MRIKPIPSIPGALANDLGQIKLPESISQMPNGGERAYKTKWIFGVRRKASRGARHEYFGVMYRGKNYKIHRLICEAFHGPPPPDCKVVIHIDENAKNNKPENLKWGTQKENLNMPGFIEYCRGRTGEDNPFVKGRKKNHGTDRHNQREKGHA